MIPRETERADDGGHVWTEHQDADGKVDYSYCRKCSIIRRADRKNKPCPGIVHISLRGEEANQVKVTRLQIQNIGMLGDVDIPINKPLVLFYGEVRVGKSTVLNAVRWCFGGAFPDDIIRHGEDEAFVQITTDSGSIRREWYRAKDGETTARPIAFIRDGQFVKRPVDEIMKLINPFLLDQNYFIRMNEKERISYLIEVLGVDVRETDALIAEAEEQARDMRAEVKAFGDVTATPVEPPPDVAKLRGERTAKVQAREDERRAVMRRNEEYRKAADEANAKAERGVREAQDAVRERKNEREQAQQSIGHLQDEIAALKATLMASERRLANHEAWLAENPELPAVEAPERILPKSEELPPAFDTTEIDTGIDWAMDQQVAYAAYQQALERQREKQAKVEALKASEATIRTLRAERLSALFTAANACPIPGLTFDAGGRIVYEDTSVGMLSTSQLMRLSSELSALYPDGLGLELIDRGESLGKSIFAFVERAQQDERTILATIVGDSPASVPEDVGVFVVEAGHVQPSVQGRLL